MDNPLTLSPLGNQYLIVGTLSCIHKNNIGNLLVYLLGNNLPGNINPIDNLYQLSAALSIDTEVANIVLLLLPYFDFYNRTIATNGLVSNSVKLLSRPR